MRIGIVVGVVIGMLIGAGVSFATSDFESGNRFLNKTADFQEGYVTGVADMIWLAASDGTRYVTDAARCLDRQSDWSTADLLRVVKAGLTANPGDAQYTMASNVSSYVRNACR